MKKPLFYGLPLAAIMVVCSLFTACEREKEPLSATEQQAANAGQVPPAGNYIPFLYGAKWAYDDGASIDTTYLLGDTVLLGRNYKTFFNTTNSYFMRYTEGVYYRLQADPTIATDSTGLYERIELRTDYGIGKTYKQQFSTLSGGYIRSETTLFNVLKERYVKGKKYNTVLEVITRFYKKEPDALEYPLGTSYQYFAKDKGLIEIIETGGGKRLTYYNY